MQRSIVITTLKEARATDGKDITYKMLADEVGYSEKTIKRFIKDNDDEFYVKQEVNGKPAHICLVEKK